MLTLNQSPVIFSESEHTYQLNGKLLSGITKRIRDRVCPDEYSDIPQPVLDVAAERGHAVHSTIELFVNYGVGSDSPEFKGFMVERESNDILKNTITAEYLVSDNETYASAIDIICADTEEENSVYLVDTKTTSKRNIPYVTWQLSVYRYFFELLNPHIKVKGAYLLWLRDDEHLFQKLELKSVEQVKILMYTDDPIDVDVEEPDCIDDNSDERLLALEKRISNYKRIINNHKKSLDEATQELLTIMNECNAKKFSGSLITASIKEPSTKTVFNYEKLKEDNLELYNKYVGITPVKGSIAISLKKHKFK